MEQAAATMQAEIASIRTSARDLFALSKRERPHDAARAAQDARKGAFQSQRAAVEQSRLNGLRHNLHICPR
jgi:hypothetical protein